MPHRLIVGLGNPGETYRSTRHNVGFEVLDQWADEENAAWKKARFAHSLKAELSSGEILLKPQSYMNLSGEVVRQALTWLKWGVEELLIVVDDAALPVGAIRLREQGSCGGHNGLRSIEACLETRQYARLRVGIGRPEHEGEKPLVGHVLGKFSGTEKKVLANVKKKVIEVIKECRKAGIKAAMQMGNKKL